jgi:hypothetical protein
MPVVDMDCDANATAPEQLAQLNEVVQYCPGTQSSGPPQEAQLVTAVVHVSRGPTQPQLAHFSNWLLQSMTVPGGIGDVGYCPMQSTNPRGG